MAEEISELHHTANAILLTRSNYIFGKGDNMDHLFIIDMQNDFLQSSKAKEKLELAKLFIEAEGKNYRINFISTEHPVPAFYNTVEYRKDMRRTVIEGSAGARVDKDLFALAKSVDTNDFVGNFIKSSQCIPTLGSTVNSSMSVLNHDKIIMFGMNLDTSIVATALNFRNAMPYKQIEVIENLCLASTNNMLSSAIDILEANYIDIVRYE